MDIVHELLSTTAGSVGCTLVAAVLALIWYDGKVREGVKTAIIIAYIIIMLCCRVMFALARATLRHSWGWMTTVTSPRHTTNTNPTSSTPQNAGAVMKRPVVKLRA